MYTFMKCLSWLIPHIPEGCGRALGYLFRCLFLDFRPEETKSVGPAADPGLRPDRGPGKAMAIARASTVRFGP